MEMLPLVCGGGGGGRVCDGGGGDGDGGMWWCVFLCDAGSVWKCRYWSVRVVCDGGVCDGAGAGGGVGVSVW